MTNQNAVAPEPVPSHLPCRRPPSGPRKVPVGAIDVGGIAGLVDAMKAPSPTHATAMTKKRMDWMMRHPSVLAVFDSIAAASRGKQIVMFLDYDGTLSPIVEDPDRAFMSDAMRDAVRGVARFFPTAIVSGRCRDKAYKFVRLAELYYAGSHDMDVKGPTRGPRCAKEEERAVMFQPAREFIPMIDEVCGILMEKTRGVPGAKIENNKFCLSVHFRCVDEKKWTGLAEEVRTVLKNYPELRLTQGRKVLEIRPTIKWDKGKALEFLLEALGFADSSDVLPIYIGDDRTDEDAFKVLHERGQGFGILVSKIPKETNASYSLQDPSEESMEIGDFCGDYISFYTVGVEIKIIKNHDQVVLMVLGLEVMGFLRRLVEWKRQSLKARPRV